ncbi:LAFE_0C03488g1_1 [Lachancea fermentati]|uniref:LAFE_0C03488g1_1 n=1 Tax=Lachancea fermentati TaxID=4955 RepID=A0A1G4M978_LACFM|nr:LAFE_0C03488g1_1 [Lachancea fermentati]
MLNRTKSFQDCKETEVPGYNDCPNLLFRVNSSKRSVSSNQVDTYGNTKPAAAPPPSIKRSIATKATELPSKSIVKTKEEVMTEIQALLNRETKLSPGEFEFYKRKFMTNISKSLENEHTRLTLAEILSHISEKDQAKKLITGWMVSDTSISSWCPAFRKIVENVII